MDWVQVVKASFGDFENAKFGAEEIILSRTDGKNEKPPKTKEIAGTYYINQNTALPPETSPEISAYVESARKNPSSDLEILIIFEDDRWVHLRTGDAKTAKQIHGIKPNDQPRPSSEGDDDGNGRD
jgi:hypothetical protein